MKISYNKIIKIKLVLSGLKNDELAEKIGVNKSTLSRNESKSLADKVYHFFDNFDPDINRAVGLIIKNYDPEKNDTNSNNVANEAYAQHGKDQEKERYIKFLENQIIEKDRQISKLLGIENKQTG